MFNQLFKNHAENERDLADLVARETVRDLFGGEERRYNIPALLMGLVAVTLLLAGLAAILYLIGATL